MLRFTEGNMPDFRNLKTDELKRKELPAFERYKEDLKTLTDAVGKVKMRNLILLANGGSNTSFLAYHKALLPLSEHRRIFILASQEPDLINDLKRIYKKDDTLVMAISKSGTNVGPLEALFAFKDYKKVAITELGKGALYEIACRLGMTVIPHPSVGGRYSGLTSSAFAPALLFGIDCAAIEKGAREMYETCRPTVDIKKNPALRLSAELLLLERQGVSEIFCPIYSSRLSAFSTLIIQLMHESVCKNGKGQTIYCSEAPESQHHTNQRFFGGKRNACGLFIRVEKQDDSKSRIDVESDLQGIKIRDGCIGDLTIPYEKAFLFEFKGTYKDALNKGLPVAEITIDKVDPYNVGQLMGFWHYVAVYSSLLREVDPFDQPQVEASKEISFELTKKA